MRKRISILATLGVLVVMALATVSAGATIQKPPMDVAPLEQASSYPANVTWNTPFVIQNLGTAVANITVDFYAIAANGNSSIARTESGTAPVGGAFTVRPQNIAALAAGKYSVVVSSDQPVGAIANEASNDGRLMAYDGAKSLGTKVSFPNFNKNYSGWNTPIYIQNAGGAAGTVVVTFINADTGATIKTTAALPLGVGNSVELDPNLAPLTDLPDGRYSVTAVGTVNIVGVLNQVASAKGLEMSVNGVSQGGAALYFPNVNKNYSGWNTPFLVQNVGDTAAIFTISYYAVNVPGKTAGSLVQSYTTASIGPGGSATERPHTRPAGELPDGAYSVKVTSSASTIAGTLNQVGNATAMAYSGFNGGSKTVSLPNLHKSYSGWETPVVIQNLGTAATNVTFKYIDATGALLATYQLNNIAPGASVAERPFNRAELPTNGRFSGVVTSSASDVAVIVNQYQPTGSASNPQGSATTEGVY